MLSWIWIAAFASDVDVERAVDLLANDRPDAAYLVARKETVDSESPRLWLTFFEACDAVGLGPACRAEVAIRGDTRPELDLIRLWHDRRKHGLTVKLEGEGLAAAASGRLEGLTFPAAVEERIATLIQKSPDAGAEVAVEWLASHPEHPEVVVPLFARGVLASGSTGKVAKLIEKLAKKALKRTTDEAVALRWHRLLRAMGAESQTSWADKVEELGGERPVEVRPLTRGKQALLAKQILLNKAELPSKIPRDREAVALIVSDQAVSAGRRAEAVAVLELAQPKIPSINLSLALIDVHLSATDYSEAFDAAGVALRAAVEAWPTDRIGGNRILRKVALSKALAGRGEASFRLGHLEDAVVDLMIGNQLALEPERVGVLEKAMVHGRYALESLKMSLETPSTPGQSVALTAATKAIENEDYASARDSASQAIHILCLPTHRRARLTATLPSRPELASAFALRALAQSRLGESTEAKIDLTIAILLEPWVASADWWNELADLRTHEGTLLARAMVHNLAEEPGDLELRSVTGLPPTAAVHEAISAALVSNWMQGHEKLEEKPTGLIVTRGRVVPFHVHKGGGGAGMRPILNRPFPAFAVSADGGTIRMREGRIYLITFARTDSPSSRRALTELNLLARRMRGNGLDVQMIGVNLDEEESAANKFVGLRKGWGTFVWEPSFGRRFGIKAFPTTWIVDSSGIARFVYVGYLGPSDYENGIKYVSAR